jgi:hypothetical protein
LHRPAGFLAHLDDLLWGERAPYHPNSSTRRSLGDIAWLDILPLRIYTFFIPVSTLPVVIASVISIFAVLIAVVLGEIVIVCRWRLGGDRQSLPDPLESFGLIL